MGLGACPVYGFLMLFGAFIDHGVEVEIVEETEGLFYKAATADTPCGSRDFIAPGGNFASRVTKRTTQWLHSLDREPASVKEDALSLLQNMRSDHVLTLTKGMTPTRQVLFARLRNGDGAAGAVALSDRFFPETKFSWLESLIVQAASRKAGEIVREVAEILKAPPRANDFKPGALTLAGYLACANLGDGILAAWRSAFESQ